MTTTTDSHTKTHNNTSQHTTLSLIKDTIQSLTRYKLYPRSLWVWLCLAISTISTVYFIFWRRKKESSPAASIIQRFINTLSAAFTYDRGTISSTPNLHRRRLR